MTEKHFRNNHYILVSICAHSTTPMKIHYSFNGPVKNILINRYVRRNMLAWFWMISFSLPFCVWHSIYVVHLKVKSTFLFFPILFSLHLTIRCLFVSYKFMKYTIDNLQLYRSQNFRLSRKYLRRVIFIV